MTFASQSALLLACLATPVAFAATEQPADPPPTAGLVLLAAADVNVPLVRPGTTDIESRPVSAGVVESLPDLPSAQQVSLLQPSPSHWKAPLPNGVRAVLLPDHAGVSTLQASPLRGAAHMVRAQRFNTDDGSSVNDFAICYRLNGRSSLQVIPGDPAPVKMPVTSMANNTGVTVGMVVRLSKRR